MTTTSPPPSPCHHEGGEADHPAAEHRDGLVEHEAATPEPADRDRERLGQRGRVRPDRLGHRQAHPRRDRDRLREAAVGVQSDRPVLRAERELVAGAPPARPAGQVRVEGDEIARAQTRDPGPTSAIRPATSCPRVIGACRPVSGCGAPTGMNSGPARHSSRSVPQIPVHSTATRTSPGAGAGAAGTSSTRTSPRPCQRTALTARISSASPPRSTVSSTDAGPKNPRSTGWYGCRAISSGTSRTPRPGRSGIARWPSTTTGLPSTTACRHSASHGASISWIRAFGATASTTRLAAVATGPLGLCGATRTIQVSAIEAMASVSAMPPAWMTSGWTIAARTRGQQLAVVEPGEQPLAGRDLDRAGAANLRHRRQVAGRDRLLEPEAIERRQRMCHPDGRVDVEPAVTLDHQVDSRTDGAPDRLDDGHGPVQARASMTGPAVPNGSNFIAS